MTWSRACRICYAANHPQPCCAAQAATEAAGAISAPHAVSASAAPIFLPSAQPESRMVPKSRTRVLEPAAPRAPGRTMPPARANKDRTSWPGMQLRPRYPLPPETTWQHPCWRLSQSMGRYDGTAMWNFGELSAAMRPARTLKFADGAALRDRRTQVGLSFPGNTVRLAWSADLKIVLRP
jgi:hypothetical protein